jgi:hypothetical protein
MPNFDLSRIQIFQAGDWSGVDPNKVFTVDQTATYAMIDADIISEAMAGLPMAEQGKLNALRYFPTDADYATRGFPTWAGASPPPVYFKVTGAKASHAAKLQAALAKRFK